MLVRIRHRGPDDEGRALFLEKGHLDNGCGFVHTRLSILDLSAAAHQPMSSDDGRFTIVFNGEIYNFLHLRLELERDGVQFVSRSDTEVILKLFQRYGPKCVERLEGMFAFAIWDSQQRSCFLARDPLGIKPLYIWRVGRSLAFASEVGALLAADLETPHLSEEGLKSYLLFGSAQEPLTPIKGIESLPAGSTLTWNDGESRIEQFWDLRFGSEAIDEGAAVKLTRAALDESIRRHFVSDVPVGILLSGGIDSTAIVALAQANGFENLDTFCISFDDPHLDEGPIAQRTAQHFGTRHHECRLDRGLRELRFHEYLAALDLPSCDGFNSFCATKFTRAAGIKVLLSGLGGDELFGGYPTFSRLPQLLSLSEHTKRLGPLRSLFATAGKTLPSARLQRLAAYASSAGDIESAYLGARGIFGLDEADTLIRHYTGRPPKTARTPLRPKALPPQPTLLDSVSYLETTRYMRNQILRDSDVFSMANGLELRVPFSDHRLYAAVGKLPAAIRLQPNKRLLTQAVGNIPPWVLERPKRGFTLPLERWFPGLHSLDAWAPLQLRTWYRRWTLLTLNSFLSRHKIGGIIDLPS